MKRRHLLAAGLGAPLASLAAPAIVRAEGKYPERIVRLVLPFAPALIFSAVFRPMISVGPAGPNRTPRRTICPGYLPSARPGAGAAPRSTGRPRPPPRKR